METLKSPGSAPRILVTGSTGLVGGAVCKRLRGSGFEVIALTRNNVDLLDRDATFRIITELSPDVVVAAAALVGGIAANMAEPVRFLVENTQMQNNLMLAAAESGVSHLVFMSSSCIYPRQCEQPMRETHLMSGPLEPTNESYAIAKLSGMQLANALHEEGRLRSTVLIPCNIYGPGDSFNLGRAHVASALVRKFVDAKQRDHEFVSVWGTGKARRELMHSADLGTATEFVIQHADDVPPVVNIGTGTDHAIAELAELIKELVGFRGDIVFDTSKPDGMPRKVLDTQVMDGLGWKAQIPLQSGLLELIHDYEKVAVLVAESEDDSHA